MKKFKNLLFATQGLPGHSDALEQAIQLAGLCQPLYLPKKCDR
ncbi:hypothetical protein ACT5DV_002104 [Vibrio cholerae]